MIKFKVVRRKGRSSAFSGGFYKMRYPLLQVVHAPVDTQGIFVFDTKRQAKAWIRLRTLSLKIIRVETIGRGHLPKAISRGGSIGVECERYFDHYYRALKETKPQTFRDTDVRTPPDGTRCYKAVRALT